MMYKGLTPAQQVEFFQELAADDYFPQTVREIAAVASVQLKRSHTE